MSRKALADSSDWRPLYPFLSRWLGLPRGRLHYLDEGASDVSKPRACLLFVHGNPTWSFHWRRLIRHLSDRYRCVAIDHMGCGWSEKPDRWLSLEDHIENLTALIESLDPPAHQITLFAQDWGGAIGLGAMLRMPERLQRMVLFNSGAFPPPYIPWQIRACRVPWLGRLAVQGGNLFSRAALRMTLARCRRLEPAVAAGYLAPYDTWAHRRAVYGFVRDIPYRPHHPTWRLLAKIERQLPSLDHVPAALIWGLRDWCFRPECLERFVALWPNAQVYRLADVGHWVVEDAPQESLAIVEQFLATTNVAGTLSVS